MALHIGKNYTRDQIRAEVGGGDKQSYLPTVGGTVICGCFNQRFNRLAPIEIDIGSGVKVRRTAEQFLKQSSYVPIFIKRGANTWEYVGKFKAVVLTEDKLQLFPKNQYRRKDAIAVLYLESEKTDSDGDLLNDPGITGEIAFEGGVALATHLRRERSRQLTEAKRRAQIAELGRLQCEGCDLTSETLPAKIGEACFEVHHRVPLGTRQAASETRLADLAILCANCHRMIHRTNPLMVFEELRRVRGLA